jgi:hypothetical protein
MPIVAYLTSSARDRVMSEVGQKRRFAPEPVTSGLQPSTDFARPARLLRFVPRGDIRLGSSLRFRTDGNANCAGPRLASGIALKDQRRKGNRGVPTKAVLYLFRVRRSANWSWDPIVAGKRPNSYFRNYPELQAWIEMAHRPLIEVNDAARL